MADLRTQSPPLAIVPDQAVRGTTRRRPQRTVIVDRSLRSNLQVGPDTAFGGTVATDIADHRAGFVAPGVPGDDGVPGVIPVASIPNLEYARMPWT